MGAMIHIDVGIGRPLDPVNLKKATKAIEDYFQSQGWINVKAESFVENLSPTEVKITFKITGTNF
jgi:outer membrane protein assembly factor BamA